MPVGVAVTRLLPVSLSKGLLRGVPLHLVGLGGREAFALHGEHVQQDGAAQLAHFLEPRRKRFHVVPVHGADVAEAEGLEEHPRRDGCLDAVLDLARDPLERAAAHAAQLLEELPHVVFERIPALAGRDAREVLVQRAHVGVDGDAVVVQHHHEVGAGHARVVEALEGEPARHGPVADDGEHFLVGFFEVARARHAERGGDGGGGVRHAKGVGLGLGAFGEAGQAAVFALRVEVVPAPGEDLMAVRLVPHVPHERVGGCVVGPVRGDGELHHAERGAEVAAVDAHHVDDVVAELLRELGELLAAETANVGGAVDLGEEGAGLERGLHRHGGNRPTERGRRRQRGNPAKYRFPR